MGAGLTADQIYVFAKKCKDNSTRGFIDFIFKQTKGTISKNDIRIAVKRGEPKAAFTARAKAACEAGLPEPRRRGGLPRIPTVIKRTEIETYAKKFYGYEARLAKKAEKKKQLATMREKTAHNARARRYKSQTNRRNKEIERIASFWNMSELNRAKDVKNAHLLDKDLSRIAVDGSVPIEIVRSPYLQSRPSPAVSIHG